MLVPFVKTQTVGNDFVLVRSEDIAGLEPSDVAIKTGDRHFGVGHDGLLVVSPDRGNLKLRFFNPDGTEDFCGNGIRCAALYAFVEGWCGAEFVIHQLGRKIPILVKDGVVTSTMPGADLTPEQVPVCADAPFIDEEVQGVKGTAVSTGSTHFVAFVDELPETPGFERVSTKVENDPVFPQKTTVMWTRVDGPKELSVRIWERGVGETLGCGTGSIACATVHSMKTGETGSILVKNPGGNLRIEVEGWDRPVKVSSRPQRVFEGEVEI